MRNGPTLGDPDVVRAAGGVVWRRSDDAAVADGALEVLVVHRDRYDDWTFPKGKLDPGETWEQAAVREVFEETGVVAVLGEELASTRYRDAKGRPKVARYWTMTVATSVPFAANEEISALQWVAVDDVVSVLTYPRDHPVLASFRGLFG